MRGVTGLRHAALALAAALIASSAAADEGAARAALERAVREANDHAGARYAFTASITDETAAEGSETTRLRFDPRRPKGKRWSAIGAEAGAVSDAARRRLKSLSRSNEADRSLIYATLAASLGEAQFLSSSEGKAEFAAPLRDPDTPAEVRQSVDLRIVVDVTGAFVERIEVISREPFKPAPVARVDSFVQVRSYAPQTQGGPALLRVSRTEAMGEAMFKSFTQRSRTEFSEFELVSPASAGG